MGGFGWPPGPENLYTITEYFGIGMDEFFHDQVNYWNVAEKFGLNPPYPARYLEFPYSKIRETLPIQFFLNKVMGSDYTQFLLEKLKINNLHYANPDQTIGVYCNLDLLRHAIQNKLLNDKTLPRLIACTRDTLAHDSFNSTYQLQTQSTTLLQTLVLNSAAYDSNFSYKIENCNEKSISISITPQEHMQDVEYGDPILSDFLCRYKKRYFADFPKYISQQPFDIKEQECLFHGGKKCVYELSAAS